LTYSFLHIL